MRHLFAVVLGSLLAAGCVGGEEGTNPPTPDAPGGTDPNKQGPSLYAANVHPAMAKCSSDGCHNITATSAALGKFYAMDATQAYAKITTAPSIIGAGNQAFASIAPILSHIAAGHKGIVYTGDEISKITAWLAKETDERKGSNPGPPPVDPKEVLKTFSGCLTIADFNTANMAPAWGNMLGGNGQKCQGCHGTGLEGFIANATPTIMFPMMTENTAYLLKFFSVDTNVMPAKVIINTGSMMNAGVTIASHPRFNPTTNAGMTALKTFYDAAIAKQTAGTCGPPTLKD